jgi:hypothetical protein
MFDDVSLRENQKNECKLRINPASEDDLDEINNGSSD